jgi:hypothetical protein
VAREIARRWIGFSEDDAKLIADGANIRPQSRVSFANALRTTRPTWRRLTGEAAGWAETGAAEWTLVKG